MRTRRKKKHFTKSAGEVQHFQKRCIERAGYIISQRTLKEMLAKHELPFIERQSKRISVFKLPRKLSDPFVVVYDSLRHKFVTIMYWKEFMEKRHPGLKFSATNKNEESFHEKSEVQLGCLQH